MMYINACTCIQQPDTSGFGAHNALCLAYTYIYIAYYQLTSPGLGSEAFTVHHIGDISGGRVVVASAVYIDAHLSRYFVIK